MGDEMILPRVSSGVEGPPRRRRELNALGVRCAESQADGVPCPSLECNCDECARAFAVTDAVEPENADA